MNPPAASSRDKNTGLVPETRTAVPELAPRDDPLLLAILRPFGVVEIVHGVGVSLSITVV